MWKPLPVTMGSFQRAFGSFFYSLCFYFSPSQRICRDVLPHQASYEYWNHWSVHSPNFKYDGLLIQLQVMSIMGKQRWPLLSPRSWPPRVEVNSQITTKLTRLLRRRLAVSQLTHPMSNTRQQLAIMDISTVPDMLIVSFLSHPFQLCLMLFQTSRTWLLEPPRWTVQSL